LALIAQLRKEEVRCGFTAIFVCITAIFVMQFLDFPEKHARAEKLFQEYFAEDAPDGANAVNLSNS
jgi:hypothetical protein